MEQTEFAVTLRNFIKDVKVKKITGSYYVAEATVNLFEQLVKQNTWETAKDLISLIKMYGTTLITQLPLETSACNAVLRLLKIVRDEYTLGYNVKDKEEDLLQDSLHNIVTSVEEMIDYDREVKGLRECVLEHIAEFQTELETSIETISKEASNHVYTNEVILTVGKSNVVEAFLKEAAKKRKFEVIVCECFPSRIGCEMAANLSKRKIQTTLVPDSAIFGIMSRVNKVIIGTQAVMAHGGLRAICGSHIVALAAKRYSVPVIVLSGMYKLSPRYLCSYDQDNFNEFKSPEGVLTYAEATASPNIYVYNPVYDYVPPDLVTLFISNLGVHAPSYMYRLVSELYHTDDKEF